LQLAPLGFVVFALLAAIVKELFTNVNGNFSKEVLGGKHGIHTICGAVCVPAVKNSVSSEKTAGSRLNKGFSLLKFVPELISLIVSMISVSHPDNKVLGVGERCHRIRIRFLLQINVNYFVDGCTGCGRGDDVDIIPNKRAAPEYAYEL
jgi:hypothetical protein